MISQRLSAFAVIVAAVASAACASAPKQECAGDAKTEKTLAQNVKDESVAIVKTAKACEMPNACGVQMTTELVWTKGSETVDTFTLDSDGCELASQQTRKPATVDLAVEQDNVLIKQQGDEFCQVEVVKIDRSARKLREEPQRKCHSM